MSKLIAVDAGHGLHTAGKRTPDGEREWSFNNKVVIALIDELHRLGLRTVRLDDPSGQRDVPLGERTRKANNAKADVLVSVHHNALTGRWGNHTGTEIYSYPGSKKSKELADKVQPKLAGTYGLRNRGAKTANFHMLRESNMPAILTEGGYMDSRIDIVKLRDNEVLKQAGINIARGVANYLGVSVSGGVKPNTSTPTKKPTQPKKQASTGGSIVDYLNSKKINSSFANRKKLAREYLGISNYSGTAKQNTDLLNAMRSGKKPAQPKATSNNVSNYKGGSIVDYLNLSGNKHLGGSSFNNRKKLAEANGIRGYTGTAAQNKQLLLKLQGGSVATPTRSVNVNAIAEQIKKGIDSQGRRIPIGHEPRRKHFGLTASEYAKVRARVNQIM